MTDDGNKPVSRSRMALVCQAKDEDYYLYEWIDYHFRLGFDDVYVYCNDWKYTGKLPDLPGHRVVMKEWNGHAVQMKAYNDFIDTFSKEYDWAAFLDVDEYLANNVKDTDFIDVLSRYSGYPQLAVNWRFMGDSGLTSFDPSDTSLAFRFTKGGRRLFHACKQLINLKWHRDAGKAIPRFGPSPHYTTSGGVSAGGIPVSPSSTFSEHGLDTVLPIELYHYRTKTEFEFNNIRLKRGDACSRDGGFDAIQLRDLRAQNLNEIECTTVRDFYAKSLGLGPTHGDVVQDGAAEQPVEQLAIPQPDELKTLSVLQIHYEKSRHVIIARSGLVPCPTNLDWRVHALPIYHGLDSNTAMRSVEIKIDTMPLATVDQIVELSELRPPEFLVLDGKEYGIPVLYGAMHTLKTYKPTVIFSGNSPEWKRDYDTVEHYMRFIDLMTEVHYWLLSRPSKYDYLMQYAEVPNA